MFERFTERARQVVVLAQDEARALRHNYIGTEHMLLGLARENDGVAARLLLDLGVDAERIRSEVIGMLSGTPGTVVPAPATTRVRLRRMRHRWPLEAILAGWAVFGVAAAVGVFVGWLIWG